MPKKTIKQACELCFKHQANSLTHNRENNKWYFCCCNCLKDGYEIEFNRLGELDWYHHMMVKGWIHEGTFIPRFTWAYKQFHGKNLTDNLKDVNYEG